MSVHVHVALKGGLADRGPTGAVELPDGADATALLTACGLDRRGCIVVVNGAVALATTQLRTGDRVQVYPAQAGG